ncbi:MAG TPA: hypothetical protein VMH39_11535 [Gemmatimonadaceae bacterium]|nr:hypothetical protein [Gemmatimonadaceae bacterium]
MPCVIACLTDRPFAARLKDAHRGHADVHFVETYAELQKAVRRESRPISAIVITPTDSVGTAAAAFLREFTRQEPDIPITAYCQPGIAQSPEIRRLAAAGVHEFLFRGTDDAGFALRGALESAQRECTTDAVMRRVAPLLPVRLHTFVQHAVAHPSKVKRLRDVARGIGLSQRTISRYCEREGFPAPVVLLGWSRLFPVAYLLGTTRRTVESIALELDWPSDTALRNAIRNTVGCRASEVRERGGLDYAIRVFCDATAPALRRPAAVAPGMDPQQLPMAL